MFQVHRHDNAEAFLHRAESWLMQHEAEHNLLLGLAHRLTTSTAGFDAPIYLATIEKDGALAGCAFRTPPHKVGLTRMPEAAVPALVQDLSTVYEWIPAVLGPELEAQVFATLWSRQQGVLTRAGMRQRIYQLDEVVSPDPMPPGHLRRATHADLDRLTLWLAGFGTDAGIPTPQARQTALRGIDDGFLYLWEDERPVSMAGWPGRTPHGARIGYVYTPPALRGRGYGTACTAALSQHLLDEGLRFCFLYTNLANPISNHIYQRIGYKPVCDVLDYDFENPAAAA